MSKIKHRCHKLTIYNIIKNKTKRVFGDLISTPKKDKIEDVGSGNTPARFWV